MLVVKRKSLVISMLVVLLVITGYLNFAYNQNILDNNNKVSNKVSNDEELNDPQITVSDASEEIGNDLNGEEDKITDVSATSGKVNFFVNYRLERENTRRTEIEYIKEIVNNPNSDPDMKKEAQAQLLQITSNMEKELNMEGLIKAKGFEDAIVIMNQDNVNVIVNKKELMPEEVAQILDIVKRESGKDADNIKIIPMV